MKKHPPRSGVAKRGLLRVWATCFGPLLALALASAGTAGAATFKVTNTHDSGPGTLRRALHRADTNRGVDRVVIRATGAIRLESALPVLNRVAIKGPGAGKLTVRRRWHTTRCTTRTLRAHCFYVFDVGSSSRLSGISIANGVPADVFSEAYHFYLSDSVVRDAPEASFGGCNPCGGWGIWVHGFSTEALQRELVLANSVVRDNGSWGIRSEGAEATLRRSTVRENRSGGITNEEGCCGAELTVSRSTVNGNGGPGISNTAGATHAHVQLSTLSANSGFAIDDRGVDTTVSQSTLSANNRSIFNEVNLPGTTTTLKSTIVANSLNGDNCVGTVTSEGHNLSDDGSCGLAAQGDQPNTDPLLRPLGDYGGPTRTAALRPTSPAVDAGFADGTTTDQRGLPRIVNYPHVPKAAGGDNSDIGSFELQR